MGLQWNTAMQRNLERKTTEDERFENVIGGIGRFSQ